MNFIKMNFMMWLAMNWLIENYLQTEKAVLIQIKVLTLKMELETNLEGEECKK